MNQYKPQILNIAEICYQKGLEYVIISPGSRSAPLTLAFLRHGKLKCLTLTDERSAAFTAMGIAQQTQKATILICTSGTAILNYAPAVTESFYQKIPLLILTADRPPEWTDQFDNQSIRQSNIYSNHILKSFNLPVEAIHKDDKWFSDRIISEAINLSDYPVKGPVHINISLREPLYPQPDDNFNYQNNSKIISIKKSEKFLDNNTWKELIEVWDMSKNIVILGGLSDKNISLEKSLTEIQNKSDAVLISDITSNLFESTVIKNSDMILSKLENAENLKTDLLITFGGPIVSKSIKNFLKSSELKYHWHIQESGLIGDTFQALTDIIDVKPEYFFREILNKIPKNEIKIYRDKWENLQEISNKNITEFFNQDIEFNEFKAIDKILKFIPENTLLQIGNSMVIRYINYIANIRSNIKVNSNRGTSGIDGSISTAVGACIASNKITTIITGDLSFFYDRNGLWNNKLPNNLRIIVMNNHGGGIFRIIDGPSKLNELDNYFETKNTLNVENTAKDFNFEYFKVKDFEYLDKTLEYFYNNSEKPKILEIETDSLINSQIFNQFKLLIK